MHKKLKKEDGEESRNLPTPSQNASNKSRWWPGNPNPPVVGTTAENIITWAFLGTLSVGSVFLAAGATYTVNYYFCMIEEMEV